MPPASSCMPIAIFGAPVDHVASEDDVAELATTMAVRPHLLRCVARLPKREQAVIVLRFGLFGFQPRTLREVAAELDGGALSLGTIHAAERHALELLREWF